MYITNPETIPKEKLFSCKKAIAWKLIYEKHLPLFSRTGRMWYFAKTDILTKALEELGIRNEEGANEQRS